MNPTLSDTVKEEIKKILDVGLIYHISNSEWVSPLVIVTRKGENWRVFIDYRQLNKATRNDNIPLHFIGQVLYTLLGNNFFCFLDGFSGYNQIQMTRIK
jgi:hypothetical protein